MTGIDGIVSADEVAGLTGLRPVELSGLIRRHDGEAAGHSAFRTSDGVHELDVTGEQRWVSSRPARRAGGRSVHDEAGI